MLKMIFYRKEAETQLLTSRLEEEQSLVARLQKQVVVVLYNYKLC